MLYIVNLIVGNSLLIAVVLKEFLCLLGVLLCRRMDNAKRALSEAKENLKILQEEFPGTLYVCAYVCVKIVCNSVK